MTLEEKYRVLLAEKGSEALELFHQESPDLILLDIGLPDISGMDVLKDVKKKDPDAMVIMVTAIEEVKTIVEAVKLGAYDYLVKPIDAQELLLTAKNALENKRLKHQLRTIQKTCIDRYTFDIIGESSMVKEMIATAKKVSVSVDTPVLLVGESGAGKGVLARAIHYSAKDVPGPFVTVNCGAIPKDLVESELFGYERGAFTGAKANGKKGRFEEATGGTLFLDEIGVMSLSTQAKLLGIIENRTFYRVGGDKEVSVSSRIIAATNTDLEKAVEQGLFRRDLYYRLNVVKIEVPPLRERPDDIIPLTEHFMTHYNHKFGKQFIKISPETKVLLLKYQWPGNVRELRNTIERAVLLEDADTFLPKHFAVSHDLVEDKEYGFELDLSRGGIDYNEVIKTLIKEALKQTRGNVSKAAQHLKMPAHKLRYQIKKYGLRYNKELEL